MAERTAGERRRFSSASVARHPSSGSATPEEGGDVVRLRAAFRQPLEERLVTQRFRGRRASGGRSRIRDDDRRAGRPAGEAEAKDVAAGAEVTDRVVVDDVPAGGCAQNLERKLAEFGVGCDERRRRPATASATGSNTFGRARRRARLRCPPRARVRHAGRRGSGRSPSPARGRLAESRPALPWERPARCSAARRPGRIGERELHERGARGQRVGHGLVDGGQVPRQVEVRDLVGERPLQLVAAPDELRHRVGSQPRPVARGGGVAAPMLVRSRASSRSGSARCGWRPPGSRRGGGPSPRRYSSRRSNRSQARPTASASSRRSRATIASKREPARPAQEREPRALPATDRT